MATGQIAHLDGDRDNNTEDNLAFLCFVHHDEYDSQTSQRKGLTINEVKRYREELVTTINRAFTQQVHFGEIKTPACIVAGFNGVSFRASPDMRT